MIQIVPVQTKRDWKLFERVPELLHRERQYFLPPFPGSVSRLRKKTHPFYDHGAMFPFLALRDGQAVGRIAGIINETHNEFHRDLTGFFGFFDFIDDIDVAAKLFDAAKQVVAARGRRLLRGPYNPTQNDECGVLVEGFDAYPFLMLPYNPQYYVDIYDRLDLIRVRDLYAFDFRTTNKPPERVVRAAERLKRKTSIKVRSVRRADIRRELEIVRELFNRTLDREWGFMPIGSADLEFAVRDLKAILDPRTVLVAEADGKPIGIAVSIPNVNEFMIKAKSSRGLLRTVKLIWYLKTRRPRQLRLAILGVDPKYRSKGVAPVFYLESFELFQMYPDAGEISWVQDINVEIIRAIELMGARRSKTYTIYEKTLPA